MVKSMVPTVGHLKDSLKNTPLKKMQATLAQLLIQDSMPFNNLDFKAASMPTPNKAKYYMSRASRTVNNRIVALKSEISKRTRALEIQKIKTEKAKERAKERERTKKQKARERKRAQKAKAKEREKARKKAQKARALKS
jgi:hypothetical protein